MEVPARIEGLLRELAPQTLAAVTRRYGHFDLAEDALQEALLAAARAWPEAMPVNPAGWLTAVTTRRLTDLLRSEQARRRREQTDAARAVPTRAPSQDVTRPTSEQDDSLVLLFLCCHPPSPRPRRSH